jgi:adenylylsulfate kinase
VGPRQHGGHALTGRTERERPAGPSADALLLTGPVGAGKTTLAKEAGELLRAAGVPHAVIELDWLAWCSPPAGDTALRRRLVLDNLGCVIANYEAAGIARFILAGSIVSVEHLQAIEGAVGRALTVVRITAPLEVVFERVDSRDPASKTIGSLRDLAAFEARVRAAAGACACVENATGDVPSTAARVLTAAGWDASL